MPYFRASTQNGTGMPLDIPTNVSITNADEAAVIVWTDPSDIVIEGQTIVRWSGTLLVRKAGAAPTSKTDGVVVLDSKTRNAYSSTGFTDSNLTNGQEYYYGIFPYSTQKVYNYSYTSSVTPSAIYPTAVSDLAVSGGNAQATVTWTQPADATSVNIVVESSVTGEADRTFTAATSPLTVTGLTNDTTYTVKAVSVNAKGRTTESSGVTVTPRAIIKFAVHYSENNSDPNSCDYPAGYDNYGWTPMYVNLSTGVPVYNSWDKEGTNGDLVNWLYPRSCMVLQTGTVDYYINENDETKKADGTSSDVANTSYAGNAMMEWGQDGATIHWKILPDSDGKGWTFVVANAADPNDSDLKPWNHWNCDGDVAPHFYTAKYNGSNINSVVRSLSGQTCYVNENDANETTKCRANNKNNKIEWDKEVYSDWMFVGLLCVLFTKSTGSQAKLGYGYANGNSGQIRTGTMNGKGMFYGESSGKYGVKVFGMENFWGNIWRRIRGLINVNGSVKVKMTYSQNDGSTVTDYNQTGSGYLTAGTIGGKNAGYISAMNIQKYGLTPKTISGSDSTYYCDGVWFNNSLEGMALVGGELVDALLAGVFSCFLGYTAFQSYSFIGVSLSFKPLS